MVLVIADRRTVEDALTAALAAPSVLNTQPWRLGWEGDAVLVRADRRRALPVLDPLGRELTIGCGTLVTYAEIALTSRGVRCAVQTLPDPQGSPDLLAVLRLGSAEPDGNSHRSDPARAAATRLAAEMAGRHADRSRFADKPVPDLDLVRLGQAAEAHGAWLVALHGDRRIETAVLHSWADTLLRRDEAAAAELTAWTRDTDAPNGVPRTALPGHGLGRACSFESRDFDPGSRGEARADARPPQPEHPAVLVLCTRGDGPDDWMSAGRALARVLLEAAAAGLVTSPLNQALQVPGLRWRLRHQLGLTGTPQYQLRMGFPSGDGSPPSGRRHLSEVLEAGSTARAADGSSSVGVSPRTATTTTPAPDRQRTDHKRAGGMNTLDRSDADVRRTFDEALVVAVDDSAPAAAALRFAADLAGRTGDALHVLMVWNLVIGPAPDASPDEVVTEHDRQREADRVLTSFVDRILTGPDQPVLHQHAVHANVDALLELVSRTANHIIVGSRGRGGVADMLLGSTSARLVDHARCPVTVVPSSRDR